MIHFFNPPIDYYIRKMRRGERYTYAKFGDGEVICMLKWLGVLDGNQMGKANTDDCKYIGTLGEAIHNVLTKFDESYMLATTNLDRGSLSRHKKHLVTYFDKYDIDYMVHDADSGLYGSIIRGGFLNLVKEMKDHPIIMVSSRDKRDLKLKLAEHVEIAPKNSWLRHDKNYEGVVRAAEKYDDAIIAISAGMESIVLADRLFPDFGKTHWIINFGSIWDGFLGKVTRSYHKTSEIYKRPLL